MEILIGILLVIFYLTLLAYPVFGLIQVLRTIICYFKNDRHPLFYRDARRYFAMVIVYALFGFILFNPKLSRLVHPATFGIYLFLISFVIAMYNIHIFKKERHEEIEKLIF